MSAHESQALDAIAFQLVAALEEYEQSMTRLIETWPDMVLYREVSEAVEHIRMYSAALPELRVAWVEVLITHAELVHHLWRREYGQASVPAAAIADLQAHHGDAIAALRNRCLRFLAQGS